MAGPAGIFREIHRLRAFAVDLQSRIDFAPKQLKAQQAVLAKREEDLKNAQDDIKRQKVAIHEHETTIKAEQQLIKKYEHQLNDITSKKEYDALRHEIAGVNTRIRGLEDETLGAMLELDELTARVPPLEAAIKKAKAEFTEFERDYASRAEDWVRQRDDAMKTLAVEEAKLPGEVRAQYDRLVKTRGADGFAGVEGRNCAACYTELTAQLYNNVRLQQFVICMNCGRVVYLKDDV